MRKINSILFLLLISFSLGAGAKIKQAVIFGGGGEPNDKPDTIFDDTYENYVESMQRSGWTSSSFFDSGHPETEKMTTSLSRNNQPFTQKNFNRYIDSLKNEIQSGKLKSGDQIFVQISTHGSEKSSTEFTHRISTVDGSVDMTKLKELRDIAEAKGIKLAIADMSCHSGASLALASDKTCVVSMASTNVAFNTDGDSFSAAIAPGRSLEDVFLSGRKSNSSPGFPQISSPAGRRAAAVLSDIQKNNDYFSDVLTKDCHSMTAPDTFKKLLADLDAMEKKDPTQSVFGFKYWGSGAGLAKQNLVNAIQTYESKRSEAVAAFNAAKKLDQSACASGTQKKCPQFHQLEELIKIMSQKKMSGPELTQYQKAARSPAFANWKRAQAAYADKIHKLKSYSDNVGKTERSVYGMLYKAMSERSDGANPCKEFVF